MNISNYENFDTISVEPELRDLCNRPPSFLNLKKKYE